MSSPIDAFIQRLRKSPAGNVFNPWWNYDPLNDASQQSPRMRRENLRAYLEARIGRAALLLVAEAVGFRGAKFSGIAMTCERQLLRNGTAPHPRTSSPNVPLSRTDQQQGVIEPTAMIVERTLAAASIDPAEVVLWNTFPWHPHKPGQPLTNRTPTPAEVAAGSDVLRAMLDLMPGARLIAVGKIAQREIHETQLITCPCVRHPANGGATEFARGLAALVR